MAPNKRGGPRTSVLSEEEIAARGRGTPEEEGSDSYDGTLAAEARVFFTGGRRRRGGGAGGGGGAGAWAGAGSCTAQGRAVAAVGGGPALTVLFPPRLPPQA
jgi:hypothetical protein